MTHYEGLSMEGFAVPAGVPRGPNCGVTAVAVLTGKSFADVWEAFRAICNKGPRWEGLTSRKERDAVCNSFGFDVKHVRMMRKPSLHVFTKMAAVSNVGPLLVRTGGHVQVIWNNHALDQSGVKPIGEYWGRNKRVSEFSKVTRRLAT